MTTLILKELLTRIFLTEAKNLLIKNIGERIQNKMIEKTIHYIKRNFKNKITIDQLTEISGAGKTKFFNMFKNVIGMTPVHYIIKERINHSKKLMTSAENLQTIAFRSGFHTYEHFYKSFKKAVGFSPLEYKRQLVKDKMSAKNAAIIF